MKIKKFIKDREFIKSFTVIEIKRFTKIILLDILFIIALLAVIALFTNTLRYNMDALTRFDLTSEKMEKVITSPQEIINITWDEKTKQDFDELPNALSSFLSNTISILIISLLLFGVVSGLIKGKVYTLLLKRKFNKSFFIRFSINSLSWLILWLLIIGTTALKVSPEHSTIPILIELFLFLVTSPLFFIFSHEKSNFFIMLLSYLKLLILRSYRFIIPLIMITIVFLFFTNFLIPIGYFISKTLYFILLILFFFLFFAWTRNYLYLIAKSEKL